MAIELILEVLRHSPSNLTPQEKLAAVAFAEDARVWGPGNRLDRKVFTPLDDPKFQLYIGVSSARKVKELAQSLARKGVLESVTRGQKGQVAEYRLAHLAAASAPAEAQHPTFPTAELSTPDTGALNEFSAPDTVRQHPGNRGAYCRTRENLPAYVPRDADAALGAADRQAGEEITTNPNTPEQTEQREQPADSAAVEVEEQRRSDDAAAISSTSVVGSPEYAEQVLAAVDFGRVLRRDERARLTARLGVLLAGGWTVEALVKNLGDLGGANSRVAVFTKRAAGLPDVAPVAPAVRRAPTAAEALAASDAAAAADRDAELSDADRDAAKRLLDQIRAKRAQSAPESAGGVLAHGASAKRREGAQSVASGLSRIGVTTRNMPTQTRFCTPRACRRSRPPRS